MQSELIMNGEHTPSLDEIADYIGGDAKEVWKELVDFIEGNYELFPKLFYSKCGMKPGWNVKYQKSGRSICTLYPEKNRFSILVTLNDQHYNEIELTLTSFGEGFRDIFRACPAPYNGSRWLTITVCGSNMTEDIKKVINIKSPVKR